MKLFNKLFLVFIGSLLLLSTLDSAAQCKRFTKKYCLPSLAPYIHNGQLTSTYMIQGDSAEVLMTFNAGKEYRILICSQEMIGNVQFKVLDKKKKVLYTSEEDDVNPFWDFKVTNTQQLFIHITIPEKEKTTKMTEMVAQGCVSLLVGFKE
ncbi:MAG: hypothetical protein J5I47_03405 [Vicingus serpentipes]|nr:hypothetical protein [Vicingus serpentipes]